MHVHRLSCTQSPLYLHSAMSVCMPPANAIYTLPCLCACHLQCLKPHAGMSKVYAHAHATHSVSITAPVCSTSFIWAKLHSTALSVDLVDYLAEIHGSPTHWLSIVPHTMKNATVLNFPIWTTEGKPLEYINISPIVKSIKCLKFSTHT